MNLGIPQIIYLVLVFMGLGLVLAKNGEPREENYNFGISLIVQIFIGALLVWGGFFK